MKILLVQIVNTFRGSNLRGGLAGFFEVLKYCLLF